MRELGEKVSFKRGRLKGEIGEITKFQKLYEEIDENGEMVKDGFIILEDEISNNSHRFEGEILCVGDVKYKSINFAYTVKLERFSVVLTEEELNEGEEFHSEKGLYDIAIEYLRNAHLSLMAEAKLIVTNGEKEKAENVKKAMVSVTSAIGALTELNQG